MTTIDSPNVKNQRVSNKRVSNQSVSSNGASEQRADFERLAYRKIAELDVDADIFSASFNLFRASTRIFHDFEAAVHRPRGLSIAGFRVMFTLWVLGNLQPRQLAGLSGVTRAAISGTVSTLAAAGLVDKLPNEHDGRMITVHLTDAGVELLRECYAAQNKLERQLFGTLTADEVQELARITHKLLDAPVTPDP